MDSAIAKQMADAGLNVLPAIRIDKRPVGRWRPYQTARFNDFAAFEWADALCVICGAISGDLEIFDFDCAGEFFPAFRDELRRIDAELLDRLVIEQSPSGGYHVAFRINEGGVPKNTKIAHKRGMVNYGATAKTAKYHGKEYPVHPDGCIYPCAIETRGTGGICLVAPTDGYRVVQGSWLRVPTITRQERDMIATLCSRLNEWLEMPEPAPHPKPRPLFITEPRITINDGAADWLRKTGKARELLIENGWTFIEENSEFEQWVRPGKNRGLSGSLWKETHLFNCFTSNAPPLKQNRHYTPLELYAAFKTGGDMVEAVKEVRRRMPAINFSVKDYAEWHGLPWTITEVVKPFLKNKHLKKVEEVTVGLPDRLLKIGGLIGDIMAFTKQLSQKDQPELAFAAAFACVSFLSARRIKTPSNVRPNIYVLSIANAGSGKEAGRQANNAIMTAYDDAIERPQQFESRQAMVGFLIRQKQVLYQGDEFGALLKVINGEKSAPYLKTMVEEWLRLFSSAGLDGYQPRQNVADNKPNTVRRNIVDQPHLSIYGTSNKNDFFSAINSSLISNGFIPRCFIFEGQDDAPVIPRSLNESIDFAIPDALTDQVRAWNEFRHPSPVLNAGRPDPFEVVFDADAETALFEFRAKEIDIKNADKSDVDIWARAFEKTLKTCLIFAASKFGPDPERLRITRDVADDAILLSRYQLAKYQEWKEKYISENQYEAMTKDVFVWIKSNGPTIALTAFSRKFGKLNSRERSDVVKTLEDQGKISIERQDGKVFITLKEGEEDNDTE